MINGCLLVIANVVENDTKVDMCEELACNVCNLLVLVVELDGFAVEFGLVCLSELHVIDTNTVIREGLSMHITNCLANLEESLVLLNCLLVFSEVVKEDSG